MQFGSASSNARFPRDNSKTSSLVSFVVKGVSLDVRHRCLHNKRDRDDKEHRCRIIIISDVSAFSLYIVLVRVLYEGRAVISCGDIEFGLGLRATTHEVYSFLRRVNHGVLPTAVSSDNEAKWEGVHRAFRKKGRYVGAIYGHKDVLLSVMVSPVICNGEDLVERIRDFVVDRYVLFALQDTVFSGCEGRFRAFAGCTNKCNEQQPVVIQ